MNKCSHKGNNLPLRCDIYASDIREEAEEEDEGKSCHKSGGGGAGLALQSRDVGCGGSDDDDSADESDASNHNEDDDDSVLGSRTKKKQPQKVVTLDDIFQCGNDFADANFLTSHQRRMKDRKRAEQEKQGVEKEGREGKKGKEETKWKPTPIAGGEEDITGVSLVGETNNRSGSAERGNGSKRKEGSKRKGGSIKRKRNFREKNSSEKSQFPESLDDFSGVHLVAVNSSESSSNSPPSDQKFLVRVFSLYQC